MTPKEKLDNIEELCLFFVGTKSELTTEILKVIRTKNKSKKIENPAS